MSVKEMDAVQKQALESNRLEPTNYKNSFHKDGVFEVLQSLRKYIMSVFASSKITSSYSFLILEMKIFVILSYKHMMVK